MKSERYELSGWSLDDLLSTTEGPELEEMLSLLEAHVSEVESWRGVLSPDIQPDDFVRLLDLYESISEYGNRLVGYGHLWFAADTQSQGALAMLGRMEQLFTEIENRLLFFSLWWKEIDDQEAEPLLQVSGDRRYFLESLRRFKPHTLTEAEEKVINIKDVNGVRALNTLYDMITNRYVFKLEVDGEEREMTRGELSAFYRSPSADLRKAAYRELNRVYERDSGVLGQIYIHRARDWRSENLNLRHFDSPIAVRNLNNDIPDTVVDTLLDVSRRNANIFQDYFRLKANWMGVEKLRRFDIYAPLSDVEKKYPYHQAVDLVLDGFESFSPLLADMARRVFADGHIDSEIRPGKESGAFCASMMPSLTPWVKVNYAGKADDVATLAHELGHAVHAMAAADHSILTYHSSLPLAEMASVFSEMILTERFLAKETDRSVRRNLLAAAVDDAYATVMRQAYFVLFEKRAHAMIQEGATTDDLSAAYLENLQEQFGDSIDLDSGFKWEWAAIPHIYATPFYCYAYSFGQLLVLALYQRYKETGPSFIPGYLKVLSYGGSASPAHILAETGVDMTSEAFWQGGYDLIQGMVDQLTEL